MKSKSILKLFILFGLLTASCAPKILPEEKVKLRTLEAHLSSPLSIPVASLEIEAKDYIASERILYRKGNTFGYFKRNRWICSPDCMLERLLLKSFKLQSEDENSELKLEIIDLYADFSEKSPKVVLTIRAELKDDSGKKVKIFHLERKTKNSEEGVFRAFNEASTEFLKELIRWLEESQNRAERGI